MSVIPQSYDYLFKIVVVGDSGVGKTSLLTRFADQTFTRSHVSTIGADFKVRTVSVDGKECKLQIWDTAGQERFRSIAANLYRGAHGIIIVYDISNRASFRNVSEHWWRDLQRRGLISSSSSSRAKHLLIGNKSDLDYLGGGNPQTRQVSREEGKRLADRLGMEFLEASAKAFVNVDGTFVTMARQIALDEKHFGGLLRDFGGDATVIRLQGRTERLTPSRTMKGGSRRRRPGCC